MALPIRFARRRQHRPAQRAAELLTLLDLEDRMFHRPNQLSGGQQQRVAIARALANDPPLLLCDEPTGNLDSASGALVLNALREVNQRLGTTIILVTHDAHVAAQTDRIITLVDGRVTHDQIDPRSASEMRQLEAAIGS